MKALMENDVQEVRAIEGPRTHLVAIYRCENGKVQALNCRMSKVQPGGYVLSIGEDRVFDVMGRVDHVQKADLDVYWSAKSTEGVMDVFYTGLRHDVASHSFVCDVLTVDATATKPDVGDQYDFNNLVDYSMLHFEVSIKTDVDLGSYER